MKSIKFLHASLLVVITLQSAGCGAKQSSKDLPATYKGPAIPKLQSYDYRNYDPANTELFRRAFPPGTVTFTDRFPEDSKPWSPWFLALLKDGNRILNPEEIYQFREAVALFVYHDERLVKRKGWTSQAFVKALDEVLHDGFKAVGIEEPSNELIQIGMMEAVFQWASTKNDYVNKGGASTTTLQQLININWELTNTKFGFVCADASNLSYLAITAWEEYRTSTNKGTGIIARGLGGYLSSSPSAHAWFGVSLQCAGGKRMKIQLDSTPRTRTNPLRRKNWVDTGALSRAGCEIMAASHVLCDIIFDQHVIYRGTPELQRAFKKASGPYGGVQVNDPFVKPEERFFFGVQTSYVEKANADKGYSGRIMEMRKSARQTHYEIRNPLNQGYELLKQFYSRYPY